MLKQPPRISALNSYFDYRGKSQVKDYLKSYPALIVFLQDSYKYLVKIFGQTTRYVLELATDPEHDHQTLFVYIRTPLSVGEAQARLDAFDDQWFLDHVDEIGDRLNFNLEIV